MYDAVDVNVLLIIGMKNEAPVATLSHLMPDSKLFEIHVQANEKTRRIRRRCHDGNDNDDDNKDSNNSRSRLTVLDYRLSFIFDNDTIENEAAKGFVEHY